MAEVPVARATLATFAATHSADAFCGFYVAGADQTALGQTVVLGVGALAH